MISTLLEAAEYTGTRPSTILRAMLSGYLQYSRDQAGSFEFERDQLESLVYPEFAPPDIPQAEQCDDAEDDIESLFCDAD